MRQKLYDIKLILRIVISVFVVVSMVKGCAKAYTYDEFLNFANQCRSDSSVSNTSPYYMKSRADFIYNYHSNIESCMQSNNDSPYNYNSFVTITDDGYNYLIMSNNNNYEYELNTTVSGYNKTFFITGSLTIVSYKSGNFSYFSGSVSRYTIYSALGLLTKEARVNGQAMYNSQYNKKAFYLQNNYTAPPINFNTSSLESLVNQDKVLRLNYRQDSIYLGSFQNLIENDVDIIDFSLNFGGSVWTEHGSYITFMESNDSQLFYFADNNLYIKPILLNYYYTYSLSWTCYSNTDIAGSGSESYYVLPYDAVVSGGVVTNQGSGESYSVQDSTLDLISMLGQEPSGDVDLGTGFLGGIMKGIKNLFVPDATYFSNYFSELNDFFSDRLGILYFPIEFLLDFLNRVLTIDFSNPVMTLGPYVMPLNDNFELVPEITFNFNDYLLENNLKQIHDVYLVIVDGLLAFGLIQLLRRTYENIVNNREA